MTRHSETTPATAAERPTGLTFGYKIHLARAMIRNNPRSARAFVSVAVATFGLLFSFAAINGMATMMSQSAKDIISGDISAFADGYQYSMLSPQSDVVYFLHNADSLTAQLQSTAGVSAVRPRITAGAQLSTDANDSGVVIVGSDFAAEGYVVLDGAAPHGAQQICINPSQRDDLKLKVGDTVALAVAGAPRTAAPTDARVACVYDNSRFGLFRSSFVIMDVAGVQHLLDRPDSLTQMLITLDPAANAAQVTAKMATSHPAMQFSSAATTADLIFTIQTAQQAMMWAFVLVTALICAILIGNVVALGLRRERSEIATLRTMGFDSRAVRDVYSLQVVMVGGAMVAVGTVAALVFVWVFGSTGIPIGGGQQLFGDSILHPSLSVANVAATAALLLGALVSANLISTHAMLRRSPLEMLRDD